MTKKEIVAHEKWAKEVEWDDLALAIIELEEEIRELESYIPKKELKDRCRLLKIYEDEKSNRVIELSTGRAYGGMIYGENFATNWNSEDY